MLNTKTLLILALTALLLLVVGCNQPYIEPTSIPTLIPATLPPATATPASGAAGEADAPTAEAEPVDPEAAIAAGQQIFETTCAVCHSLGSDTIVGPGMAGLFDRETLPNGNPFNEENLREWIVTGGGAMPAMPLTQEQLDGLIPYLREASQQ